MLAQSLQVWVPVQHDEEVPALQVALALHALLHATVPEDVNTVV